MISATQNVEHFVLNRVFHAVQPGCRNVAT